MASFENHLTQAKCNIDFLTQINKHCNQFIDWHVTTSFYVAVHFINAFLAKEGDLHFASHDKVKDAISPHSIIPKTRIDEATYLAYVKLRNLSRRSRYLLNDEGAPKPNAHYILEKHLIKSFKCLDSVIKFFYDKYGDAIPVSTIHYNFTQNPPNCMYFKFDKI